MHFSHKVLAAGLLPGLGFASARGLSRRAVQCYFEIPAAGGDTCEGLASSWGISVDLFKQINPGVTCPDLEPGRSYCVVGEWTPEPTTTESSIVQQTTLFDLNHHPFNHSDSPPYP